MSEMKKNIIIIIVIIALVSMTVAYATLGQSLNITGTSRIQPGSQTWDIHFANLSTATLVGKAAIENNHEMQITAPTTISGLLGSLSQGGDSIIYTFDIVNDGDVNAQIESIILPDLTGASHYSSNTTDANRVKNNVTYSLKYTSNNTSLAIGDRLNAGTSINVTLTISYNSGTSNTPGNDVYLNDLVTTINYVQATR